MNEFGQRLKLLRKEKELTQEQLAKAVGIPYTTYRKYEIGSVMPRKANMEKLEKFYKMSAGELLDIGTILTLEYDPKDIEQLRSTMNSEMPKNEMIAALGEILKRLYDQKNAAFVMDETKVALYSGQSVRTVRFNREHDQLIWSAIELQQKLIQELLLTSQALN